MEKLLLHSCCGPCSTAVTEAILDEFDITLFFYNPNITDEEEYENRLFTQVKFLEKFNEELPDGKSVRFMEGKYDPENYFDFVKGLEDEPEGGKRCLKCFELRLRETAKKAKKAGYDYFGTTLTVSPHKSYPNIKEIGERIAAEEGVKFLDRDFKKKDGYLRSIRLSEKYELYRQNYCGCEFSKWFEHEGEK